MARAPRPSVNYLDLVPRRLVGHETDADERAVLLRPKFVSGLWAKLLQPRMPRPFFKVRLDEIGTATWEAIDGARTVGEIADLLGERFGGRVDPKIERCARFIRSLERGAMVAVEPRTPAGEA